MSNSDERDSALFNVVVNDEGQYSIWPAGDTVPAGWSSTGDSGDRRACLARIEELWVDMRPLSLRRAMGES